MKNFIKKFKYILGIIILVLFALIVNNNINENKKNEVVYDYFSTQINDINKLKNDEIIGYVYFARDTCPVCLEFNKNLEIEFKKNEDLVVFKFDTDYWRENEEFKNVLNKYNVSEVPMLIKINEDKSYKILKVEKVENIQIELNKFLYN